MSAKLLRRMSLKEWVAEEAMRCGLKEGAIRMRIWRGLYPRLHLNHVNSRVVEVVSW